jgi:predicted Zn-dependent protease
MMMRIPDLAALQHYRSMPLYTWVRFGRWDDVLASPVPAADLPYMRGVRHFARAVAFARTDRPDEAAAELDSLRAAAADPAVAALRIWGINEAKALLDIADDVAAGEIAAARRDWRSAIERLRRGVEREDALTYDEPPTWQLSVRHYLGAVLLAAGRAADADAVYRADLDRFRENGWSLIGLAQALEAQGRTAEAAAVRARFDAAWSSSDIALTASRF